ncbi:Transcription factor, enhancer of yellow 2 [Kalmanozyma brasiliensis GHG001]|uniref:Transcription and mRNA export factor SUS1 n=1 Tax=Kalmanozyma brasiliensis (strain GHG001) TaxID=1365824 RepID=V5GTE8_KALBG|nr:Transcription factor, enhancer of yellow 2 [Kalmanozyma brasiliensis GHG001]EST09192.1 Transcription factor, enhancer of yellow 2 [Kalmanozyma brasiliensis GHG001]
MEEGELNPSASSSSGNDELYNALHQRLVASGEWQRLLILLRRMLDESGWENEFQSFATGKAKQQPVLSVPDLIDVLTPHAKDTIPPHVKTHLLEKLRDFLDRNLEDA